MKLGASVRVERERERQRKVSLKNRFRGRQSKGDNDRKDSVGKIASSSVLVSINSQSMGHSSSVLFSSVVNADLASYMPSFVPLYTSFPFKTST